MIVDALNPEIEPTDCPPIEDAESSKGTEMNEIFLAEPVPAVILHVTNPTGSVVAFCASEDAMVPARTIAAMERMEVGGFMA